MYSLYSLASPATAMVSYDMLGFKDPNAPKNMPGNADHPFKMSPSRLFADALPQSPVGSSLCFIRPLAAAKRLNTLRKTEPIGPLGVDPRPFVPRFPLSLTVVACPHAQHSY